MKFWIKSIFFLITWSLSAQDQNFNFDWESYAGWENITEYTKTYYVGKNHPNASDKNKGTKDRPFKTINKAAQVVQAGERVLIYGGIYRETIYPKNGGSAEDSMILYEVAPGEKVVVKGSKVLEQKWEQRKVYTDVLANPNTTYTWSRRTWVTTVPDTFFDNDYFPFKLPNILPEEHSLMPWAKLVKEIPPYTSTRALIFQNGKRLKQMEVYGDIVRVPGSFWIDNDAKTVHIHGFDSGDPNKTLIEVGTQQHLFKPQKVGLNYIHIRGLIFEHCANGFLRTSTGAVTALGGHHWIFENNIIRQNNSSGLEFGFMAFERNDPNPQNIKRNSKKDLGGIIVRNNTIHDCGTAGIRSYVVTKGIIDGNHIYNCGWQDAENYWECSGIKMLVCNETLVRRNHIHDIQGGNGIWLDWDIRYSRVTQNIIHDIQNIQGGIFIEATHYPNLVDNNFIWNIDGNGIYANDTDYLRVYHNLVANITGNVVHSIVQTNRIQNGRKLTAQRNLIYNNVFVNGLPMKFSSNTHRVDHNLYISTREPNNFNLTVSKEKGYDNSSNFNRAEIYYNRDMKMLKWISDFEIPLVQKLPDISIDFFGVRRKANTPPGPFENLKKNDKILLVEFP